ncbi:MAG: phosphoribosylformylglycinamidine cyclo-ligase [Candidatus Lokiarchaeota archaeon]|nr:phosphoribosylformylglycinamidine cyclo-ligase [Candidatus Lokiarchaeota archaeon]
MAKQRDNLYAKLGASSNKEDVHKAIENLDKGLFPGAFCKILPDIRGRKDYCSVFHADGAGTKAGLAYMYFKETDDITVFRGIVHDAMVMNIDDVFAVGATENYFLSNSIDRNGKLISGKIISTIINEYDKFSRALNSFGFKIYNCGGETADVGDLVRTLLVNASVFTTMKKADVIDAGNINKDNVIIGFASSGKSRYEDEFNSGIGSNGLTLARHGTLSHKYYKKYPECYDHKLDEDLAFFGNHELTEKVNGLDMDIGKALLSPTRTYSPLLIDIFDKFRYDINGIIHNTGGGQTKDLNFGKDIHYVKDDLFDLPSIFKIIQASSQTTWKEMYQVFNMGHRLEIFCEESIANEIIKISEKYQIKAKIIGHCERSESRNQNILTIDSPFGKFRYNH